MDGRMNNISALRKKLASYKMDRMKFAAIGGDQEQGFEQSFASLAYAYIQDKAPGLLDYMVGFQLVDRNDDNTKAVGIFGFKVGPQWVYAPVFFINGDLKGHELLYIKNKDTFVPMKENWINYLLSNRPHILGEPTPDNENQLGILQPDLTDMSNPPEDGKFASDRTRIPKLPKRALDEVMPKLASWATKNPYTLTKFAGLNDRSSLQDFLKSDVRLVKLAMDIAKSYPSVKAAMRQFYGPTLFRDVLLGMRKEASHSSILDAASQPAQPIIGGGILAKEAAADENPKVKVITDQVTTENTPELTEAERGKLLTDSYLIKDHRDGKEVSRVYNTQVEMSLVNPDCTDTYEVLVKPNGFEKCLVIHHPHGPRGRKPHCVVVRLGGKKDYCNIHKTKLFVKEQARGKSDVEEWADWYKSNGSDRTDLRKGTVAVIVSDNGQGTCAFEVEEDLGDDCYRVYWKDYGGDTRPDYLPDVDYARGIDTCSSDCDIIYFNQREGSGFKSVNGKLYIPPEAKVVKIRDPDKCKKCSKEEYDCTCEYFRRDHKRKSDPVKPGNLVDLQMEIMQKSASGELPQLKIIVDNQEVCVNRARMSKKAALFHLVVEHGLREKVAKRMIREAELDRTGGKRYYVKYAQPYPAMEGPGAPGMPGPQYGMDPAYGGVPMQNPQTDYQQVPELSAGNTDPSVYDPMQNIDPMAMQVAQQAGQTGQKEVFDTAMLSSMLKAVREDSIVDRYLGDLMKALDRLGRILFMFYWHNEEFTGRYGKQDLPELEDTLRNAFEVMGDLVLWLKEKTISPLGTSVEAGVPGIDEAARN